MHTVYTKVSDIPPKMYKELTRSTLREMGTMEGDIRTIRNGWGNKNCFAYVAIEWEERDNGPYVLAWSLATNDHTISFDYQVYVKKAYRNKGLATKCIESVTKLVEERKRNTRVYIGKENKEFWSKMASKNSKIKLRRKQIV